MSQHRIPIHRDDIAALLHYALEDWAESVGHPDASDLAADAYDRMAAAVLTRLSTLGVCLPDPVGTGDIADRAGVGRTTVDKWRARSVGVRSIEFPGPRWSIGGRPAWDWADVLEWGRSTGRVRDGDVWAPPGVMVTPSGATS